MYVFIYVCIYLCIYVFLKLIIHVYDDHIENMCTFVSCNMLVLGNIIYMLILYMLLHLNCLFVMHIFFTKYPQSITAFISINCDVFKGH